MTTLLLPFQPFDVEDSFTTAIDDAEYTFKVHKNTRDDSVYFDVYDSADKPIITSVRIVLGTVFARRSFHPLFRNGAMYAADTTNQDKEATNADIGTRVIVQYIPVLDILARRSL